MGIRCCCPNGHKLNVKAEQAGKIGVCPLCGLRFQIPFGNAQTPIREKESRPSKRKSTEDPFYLEPLPTFEGPRVPTNKPAGELLDFDLEPLPRFEETNDSTSESKEDPFLKSLGLEEIDNSADSETPSASSGESEPDSGSDLWYFIGNDGRQHGPMSKIDVQDWIKDKRVTKTTRIWQEGGRVQEARDVFPELAEEIVNKSNNNSFGCSFFLEDLLITAVLVVLSGAFFGTLFGDVAGECAMGITAIILVIFLVIFWIGSSEKTN